MNAASRVSRFAGAWALAAVAGCGPVGSGGTGAPAQFAQGPVSGFGSVEVNAEHFDDTSAVVIGVDGQALSALADLHVGSTVSIRAPVANGAALPVARQIRVSPDVVGAVTGAYDPRTGLVQVLGQPVAVEAGTTFIDRIDGGAPGLTVGMPVEVSALYDAAAQVYHATRIGAAAVGASAEVRGAVAELRAGALRIGTQWFDVAGVTLPPAIGPGAMVRVHVGGPRIAVDHWVATAVDDALQLPPDGATGSLRGAVGAVTDARHAVVDGIAVDAGTALMQPAADGFVPGARVLVHGTMDGGRLVASRVDFRLPGPAGTGAGPGATSGYDGTTFEIDGRVLDTADLAAGRFVMRGPTTVLSGDAVFVGGTAADLAAGRVVHVRGRLSRDGTALAAEVVSFITLTP